MTTRKLSLPAWQVVKSFISKVGGLLARAICIVDDIPFLLLKNTGSVGPFLLVGAGFIVFPVQGVMAIFEIVDTFDEYAKDHDKRKFKVKLAANFSKLGLAIGGLLVSGALLAFILVNLAVLEAVASIAIPAIMTIIGGVELIDTLTDLKRAKQAYAEDASPENYQAVVEAKRSVGFSATYLGFGLAITALATLGVLTGLGVVSFGFVPAAILVGVVVAALAVKIFEIVDEKKEHRFTNAIREFFTFGKREPGYRPVPDMPNLHRALGVRSQQEAPEERVVAAETPVTPPQERNGVEPPRVATPDSPANLSPSKGGPG